VRTDPRGAAASPRALKVARTAEAFGMTCELHTAIYHPLELANLHTALAMSNTGWFELLYPLEDFASGWPSRSTSRRLRVRAAGTGPGRRLRLGRDRRRHWSSPSDERDTA
jgi:L-alanine-DL-glutamate epimerase-like enolase superfamily enzyme